jgi:cytochrome c-type biogenesis protein CcmH
MQAVFWIEAVLLGLLTLLPAALALRGGTTLRDRRMPAVTLHRAQLRELERDRADGLIAPAEHQAARLEVERRLLAAADAADPAAPGTSSGRRGWIALALVAPVAVGLYLSGGHPGLPAQPNALRMAEAESRSQGDEALIATLRQGLTRLDPATGAARQGYILLGQVEASRGNFGAAAAAWHVALAHGFNAALAFQAAEAQSRADGGVSPDSAALFRRALDSGLADASWRQVAEQRLAQSEHR